MLIFFEKMADEFRIVLPETEQELESFVMEICQNRKPKLALRDVHRAKNLPLARSFQALCQRETDFCLEELEINARLTDEDMKDMFLFF